MLIVCLSIDLNLIAQTPVPVGDCVSLTMCCLWEHIEEIRYNFLVIKIRLCICLDADAQWLGVLITCLSKGLNLILN